MLLIRPEPLALVVFWCAAVNPNEGYYLGPLARDHDATLTFSIRFACDHYQGFALGPVSF